MREARAGPPQDGRVGGLSLSADAIASGWRRLGVAAVSDDVLDLGRQQHGRARVRVQYRREVKRVIGQSPSRAVELKSHALIDSRRRCGCVERHQPRESHAAATNHVRLSGCSPKQRLVTRRSAEPATRSPLGFAQRPRSLDDWPPQPQPAATRAVETRLCRIQRAEEAAERRAGLGHGHALLCGGRCGGGRGRCRKGAHCRSLGDPRGGVRLLTGGASSVRFGRHGSHICAGVRCLSLPQEMRRDAQMRGHQRIRAGAARREQFEQRAAADACRCSGPPRSRCVGDPQPWQRTQSRMHIGGTHRHARRCICAERRHGVRRRRGEREGEVQQRKRQPQQRGWRSARRLRVRFGGDSGSAQQTTPRPSLAMWPGNRPPVWRASVGDEQQRGSGARGDRRAQEGAEQRVRLPQGAPWHRWQHRHRELWQGAVKGPPPAASH
mmetsp:Transcript_31594/g.104340  ORF Transcript_31594/g.104340 Transcript_31594/m.104340 type:complete len:439 (-) Transcript_31594:375-1691(-)